MILAVLGSEPSKWCWNMTHLSSNVGYCRGLGMDCYICAKMCTKVGSAAGTWAGFTNGAFMSWFCWYPHWCGCLDACFDFNYIFWASSCTSRKWSWASHTSNVKLSYFFLMCAWFLFLFINCLMMFVKKMSASSFFYLILFIALSFLHVIIKDIFCSQLWIVMRLRVFLVQQFSV